MIYAKWGHHCGTQQPRESPQDHPITLTALSAPHNWICPLVSYAWCQSSLVHRIPALKMQVNAVPADRHHNVGSVRQVEGGEAGDQVVGEAEVVGQVLALTSALQQVCPALMHHTHHHHTQALQVMEKILGFQVGVGASQVGGLGVVVRSGRARRGQVTALYPGTLYLPHQPVFFQSLNNPFVLRCTDGVLVDGRSKGLSRMVYKSCCGRDRLDHHLPAADTSWLTARPLNPLSVGQYVNNQGQGRQSNVAYQEVTLQPWEVPAGARRLLPNLWCSPPLGTPPWELPLRLVALVATSDIATGQELFSHYFTLVHSSSPRSPSA